MQTKYINQDPVLISIDVQTFTTVGYGDIIPYNSYGKLFAAVVMLCGALTVSAPLLSIVRKFQLEYDLRQSEGI